jgi:hypothetical protein
MLSFKYLDIDLANPDDELQATIELSLKKGLKGLVSLRVDVERVRLRSGSKKTNFRLRPSSRSKGQSKKKQLWLFAQTSDI